MHFRVLLLSFPCMTLSLKALARAPAYTLPIWAIGLMFACHPRLLDLSLPPWTSLSRAHVPFTASLPGSCSLSIKQFLLSSGDDGKHLCRVMWSSVGRGGGRLENVAGRGRSSWAGRMHCAGTCPVLIQITQMAILYVVLTCAYAGEKDPMKCDSCPYGT